MPKRKRGERHSKSRSPVLIKGAKRIARREARNALQQFDLALEIVDDFLEKQRRFRFSTSQVLLLHKEALDGLSLFAGAFRNTPVTIGQSKHIPPPPHLVPSLCQEMCDYVNKNWRRNPIHLCAYVMWRMNWIHPFTDGNGRTSRIAAYMVLCLRLGYRVPGVPTVPEQIASNKQPYYDALEKADTAWDKGKVNVSELEKILEETLAKQLLSVHRQATTGRKTKGKGRTLQ
jgi:Fic family protein